MYTNVYVLFASSMVEWELYGEKLKLSRKSRGKHENQNIYIVLLPILVCNLMAKPRVMYGEREGFLLVIEGAQTKKCIYHFTQL